MCLSLLSNSCLPRALLSCISVCHEMFRPLNGDWVCREGGCQLQLSKLLCFAASTSGLAHRLQSWKVSLTDMCAGCTASKALVEAEKTETHLLLLLARRLDRLNMVRYHRNLCKATARLLQRTQEAQATRCAPRQHVYQMLLTNAVTQLK